MKRLFLLLCLAATTIISRAQTVNFGIKAGLNLSEQIHPSYDGYNHSLLAGANGGAIVDIGFKSFSIQPGIFFSMKGESSKYNAIAVPVNSSGASITSTAQIRLNYIELPVNFLIKRPLASGVALHFGGGPYLGYGFAGRSNVAINDSEPMPVTVTPANPDFGVDALAGITVKQILFDAGFSYGITNIGDPSYASHNMVISFSVGYMFK